MLAAKLRHRVDVEQLTVTRDTWGGTVDTWTKFATGVPASIVPLSGKEFVAAGAIQAAVDTRITIRYLAGIKPAMRIINGSIKYDVIAVLPDPTLLRHLTLMCVTGVNDG